MPPPATKRRPRPPSLPRWDAAKVRALRAHLGLTQQLFARMLNVRQQTVSEWEKAIYRPRGATVKLLNMIAEQAGFKYPEEK